jgi:hypothetical protein
MKKTYAIKVFLTSGTSEYWVDYNLTNVTTVEPNHRHYYIETTDDDGAVKSYYFPINLTIIQEV